MKYFTLILLTILFIGCSSKKVYFTTDSSDELLHDSIVVINSPLYDRDIYFYAYKNRLYQNVAFDNEDRKDTQIRVSMTNGKVTEDNPYIGMYRALRDALIIGLPAQYINLDYIINGKNNRIYIDSFKQVREDLYEGCIRVYDDKLSCIDNKVYIIKKPERCYTSKYIFTCINQEHLNLYEQNKLPINQYLSLKSNENKNFNKKLTQIYRAIIKEQNEYSKFEYMQSKVGELNANNTFYPINILFEVDENRTIDINNHDNNEPYRILNSKNFLYLNKLVNNSTYKAKESFMFAETKIPLLIFGMDYIKYDTFAQHIKNLYLAREWLEKNGKVYVGKEYEKPVTNEIGNVYIPENILKKYSKKELALIIRHEAIHALDHMDSGISKLSTEQLKDYKNKVPLLDKAFFGKNFFNNFLKVTQENRKKMEEFGNTVKELDTDDAVIRFYYKDKKQREKYCKIVTSLSDNKQRIGNCNATNDLIKNYFLTNFYNDRIINFGAIPTIINKIIEEKKHPSEEEKYLISFEAVKKRQERMKYLSDPKELTKYKYYFRKKIYHSFYGLVALGYFEKIFQSLPKFQKFLKKTRKNLLIKQGK